MAEPGTPRTRGPRSDARRNAAAIVEAARDCLARDPDASVDEIAQAAGVGRVTVYSHFGNRAGLLTAVVREALADTETRLGAVDLDGDVLDALGRLLEATWALTARYGALVAAADRTLPPEDLREWHEALRRRVRRLLARGRREGAVRTDMPVEWQLVVLQSVLHSASVEVAAGRLSERRATVLLRETALAALRAPAPD